MCPQDDAQTGEDWRTALRRHREIRGLTRAQLATRAGVSASALKAFENGKRHPKESTLGALIDALGLSREQANPLRASAGYPGDWYGLFEGRYPSGALDLATEVHKYEWPVFVSNQAIDVLHANGTFERLMGVDLSRDFQGPGERNFLAHASDPRFSGLFENFDDLVIFMVGLVKGDPRWQTSAARPAPWLRSALRAFMNGDPALIRRVLDLWDGAPPIAHAARHAYHIRLRYEGRVLSFRGSMTIADLWNELSWNEWIPASADTWHAVTEIAHSDASAAEVSGTV